MNDTTSSEETEYLLEYYDGDAEKWILLSTWTYLSSAAAWAEANRLHNITGAGYRVVTRSITTEEVTEEKPLLVEQAFRETLLYAFGYLVSSYTPGAYSAASGELTDDILEDLGLTTNEVRIMSILAEQRARLRRR